MSRFTLSDLASLSGIKSDTIRIWERRFNLLSPNRTLTNRRWYDDDDLKKIINISVLYRNGVKISRIAALDDNEIIEKAYSFSGGSGTTGDLTGFLVIAMNHFDEKAVNEIILRSVITRGFEKTITEVLFPFLKKVGILWQTGAIDPSTEHFITAHFRQRLVSASDSLHSVTTENPKRVLMFLPEGEYHELGLLYYSYAVKKKGHHVLYLGQSTPFDSVISASGSWSPDAVITGIHTQLFTPEPGEYLTKLSAELGRQKIYAGGILSDYASKLNLKNILPLRTEDDLDSLALSG
ncbi:MAG TPA: MerR family transcriptional regulator [Bacteroidales bacterium]|nr:MerR family transcriptional regulator [Bacteroidales bacterium]